jgi:hypothetical protein
MQSREYLTWGAMGSFAVAALHLVLGAWMLLAPVRASRLSRFFGGPDVQHWGAGAVAGSCVALCLVFVGFGLYALAAAGRGPRLPLQRPAVLGIAALYVLRGLFLLPELVGLARAPGAVPPQELGFSAVALAIGLLHAAGSRSLFGGRLPDPHEE